MQVSDDMRLGLFGGTFNPIHIGHLRAAEEIREKIGLDRVVFIPSAIPPHKNIPLPITASDRLEMVRRAVADNPFFEVSEVEIQRQGPSYTVETLQYFREKRGPQTELFFIIGMDAFLEINTWKSYGELFELSHFVVLARPGSPHALGEFLAGHISSGYQHDPVKKRYCHQELRTVYFRDVTSLDISSTGIRGLVNRGSSIRYLVPKTVAEYIISKGKYR
jgi:nicotinate-nucleotide adenylyltransferase